MVQLLTRATASQDFMVDFTDGNGRCGCFFPVPRRSLLTCAAGVAFCNLLEIISNKKLTKWNVKPRIKVIAGRGCRNVTRR